MTKLSEKALNRREVKAQVLTAIRTAGEKLIEYYKIDREDQFTCNLLFNELQTDHWKLLDAYTETFRNHGVNRTVWLHDQYRKLGWASYNSSGSMYNRQFFDHRLMLLATFHELIRSGEIKLEDYIDGL